MIETQNHHSCPSFLRRLACMFYDGLLLFSLLFVGSFLILPFTGGEAIASDNLLYPVLLFIAVYFYFTWQWIRGGQTLGMRAWRCQLVGEDTQSVNWLKASKRFFLSFISWLIIGVGFVMVLFRQDNKALHDLYSGTLLIHHHE